MNRKEIENMLQGFTDDEMQYLHDELMTKGVGDIPLYPGFVYRLDGTWTNWDDFLGVDKKENELAEALEAYTDPTNPEYDPEFDKKIRKVRPDWFQSP